MKALSFHQKKNRPPQTTPGGMSNRVGIKWQLAIICVQSNILDRCSLYQSNSQIWESLGIVLCHNN